MSRRGGRELRQAEHHHHVEELDRPTRLPLHQHAGALDHRDQHGPTLDRHHSHRELELEHTHSVTNTLWIIQRSPRFEGTEWAALPAPVLPSANGEHTEDVKDSASTTPSSPRALWTTPRSTIPHDAHRPTLPVWHPRLPQPPTV